MVHPKKVFQRFFSSFLSYYGRGKQLLNHRQRQYNYTRSRLYAIRAEKPQKNEIGVHF